MFYWAKISSPVLILVSVIKKTKSNHRPFYESGNTSTTEPAQHKLNTNFKFVIFGILDIIYSISPSPLVSLVYSSTNTNYTWYTCPHIIIHMNTCPHCVLTALLHCIFHH